MQRSVLSDEQASQLRKEVEFSLNVKNPQYSKEAMVMAVARKKWGRLSKCADFNCLVVSDDYDEEEPDKLMAFLNKHSDVIEQGTRFQIVIFSEQAHWLAIDCQMNNNQFEFFILDGAIYGDCLQKTITLISQEIPDAIIHYLSLTKETKIQRDFDECGAFALDFLFCLSKIPNLYDLIKSASKEPTGDLAARFSDLIEKNQLKAVPAEDLPEDLGCILRNMQSIKTLDSIFGNKAYKASATESLKDYVDRCIINDGCVRHNKGAVKKRIAVKGKTSAYLKTLTDSEFSSCLENNNKFRFDIFSKANEKINEQKFNEMDRSQSATTTTTTLNSGSVLQSTLNTFTSLYAMLFSNHDEPPNPPRACKSMRL
jgi:hypothetical protein